MRFNVDFENGSICVNGMDEIIQKNATCTKTTEKKEEITFEKPKQKGGNKAQPKNTTNLTESVAATKYSY